MKYLNKLAQVLLHVWVISLSAMAILGILFMAYQIFIEGVTINWGIY